jgi:Arc/MetJ family transcription regulator
MECEVEIDDDLLAVAQQFTVMTDVSDIANEALRALIQKHEAHSAKSWREKRRPRVHCKS